MNITASVLSKENIIFIVCSAYIGSWFTYRFADVVNVATAQDKDFVIKNLISVKTKIKVRPNWIDCKKFTPLPIMKTIVYWLLVD